LLRGYTVVRVSCALLNFKMSRNNNHMLTGASSWRPESKNTNGYDENVFDLETIGIT